MDHQKRIYRIYKEEGLQVRQRPRKCIGPVKFLCKDFFYLMYQALKIKYIL